MAVAAEVAIDAAKPRFVQPREAELWWGPELRPLQQARRCWSLRAWRRLQRRGWMQIARAGRLLRRVGSAVLALSACYEGNGGTTGGMLDAGGGNVVSGTVAGAPFGDAQSGVSDLVTGPGGAGVLIMIASVPFTCDLSAAANIRTLSMNIGDFSADARLPDVGSYEINRAGGNVTPGQGMTVAAQFSATDEQCLETEKVDATSGPITLTRVSEENVRGTFDLTFYGGGRLEGVFDTTMCDFGALVAMANASDGGAVECRR